MSSRRLIRRLNLHFSVLWALFWTCSASLWGFRTVFLLHHGFTNSQVGLVSSLALLLPIAVQPILSSLSDRSAFFTNRNLALMLTALGMVCCAGIWISHHTALYAVLLVLIGSSKRAGHHQQQQKHQGDFFHGYSSDKLR